MARWFTKIPDSQVVAVCDRDESRLRRAAASLKTAFEQEAADAEAEGDVEKALVDAGDIGGAETEVCANMLDAIDAAAKGGYAAVGVVMAGQSGGLGSALKALRQQCEARIVLLAQMSEEPEAIRLVAAGGNGPGAVDDYLICPIQRPRPCSPGH